jgi:Sigma-70 region 3
VGHRKRHLHDTSWRLRVSLPLKEQVLRLFGAADELHQTLGRTPTTAEPAEHLNVTEEVVLEASAVLISRRELSLDQAAGDDTDTDIRLGDLVAASGPREEPEDLLALPGLVAALPSLEREVIVLRFSTTWTNTPSLRSSAARRCTCRGCSAAPSPACAPNRCNPDGPSRPQPCPIEACKLLRGAHLSRNKLPQPLWLGLWSPW